MISFSAPNDFLGSLKRACHDFEVWWEVQSDDKKMKWSEWAGTSLKEMMRDREVTIRFLQSSDVSLRLAAISLVAEYWPPSERFAADTLRLAFDDPEPKVRGAALMALWQMKQYISDPTKFLDRLFCRLFPVSVQEAIKIRRGLAEKQLLAKKMWNEAWQKAAGSHALRMAESREVTESYLHHPEPEVRCAAIMALGHHWGPDQQFPQICERLVFEDSNAKVRSLALSCLAGCYVQTDDTRIGDLIAQLVLNESEPHTIRLAAYHALLMIRGMPIEALSEAMSTHFRFPEDVDWAFVKRESKRGRS